MKNQSLKNKNIEKYLENYAEKECFYLEDFNFRFNNVIIIPAYDESFDDLKTVLDSIQNTENLIILVINAQENSPEKTKNKNEELINEIKNDSQIMWKSKNPENISLQKYNNNFILLVDRSTNGLQLPNKTGVGLARKIAADIATKLIYEGKISSNWIHCTDADVILPSDYFEATRKLNNYSAAIYPYIHRTDSSDQSHRNAMALYELSLRHYVMGLKSANSNFAFHTIGSTIAINSEAYTKVRGFPIRESGEDFYILNKLIKTGKIYRTISDSIILNGRISDRVPFGTGKSVQKIISFQKDENEFLFYHPQIFEQLRIFLSAINSTNDLSNVIDSFSDEVLSNTLDKIGAIDALRTAINSSKNPKIYLQHFHHWFDSFRTLKFVHTMRDNYYPSMPIREIIKQPLYASYNFSSSHTLEDLLGEFRKLSLW